MCTFRLQIAMWLAVLLFFFILGLFVYYDTRKPHNFPPGPAWMPVLGSALAVHKLRKQTGYLYQATAELAKQYGPVVGLRVGKDRQVILCGYDGIKEMLSREDFDGRPQGPFYETRTWGVRRGNIYHLVFIQESISSYSIYKFLQYDIISSVILQFSDFNAV